MRSKLTLIVLLFIPKLALAGFNISAKGASASSGNTYYFSNISTAITQYNGTFYYISDPNGRPCSNYINSNCKNLGDMLTVSVSGINPRATSGRVFLIPYNYFFSLSDLASFNFAPTGQPILDSQPINPDGTATFRPLAFGEICETAGSFVSNLSSSCQTSYYNGTEVFSVYLNVINDVDGTLTNTGLADIQYIVIKYAPSIPATATSAGGLYSFNATPAKGAVKFQNLMVDPQFPGENTIGIQKIRFYYYEGGTQFDAADFHKVNLLSPFYEIAVNSNGEYGQPILEGLNNQHVYYFRAALVDKAGNAGFFTSPRDDNPSHAARPL